jgi:thioredoxin-like negative regulator of GroEL
VTALLHEMTASDLREAKAAMALFRLARRLDDRPLVLAALMRAVALEPGDLQARLKLASLLLDEQSWHAAAEHASAALAIDPTDILAQRLCRRARRGLLGKIPAHEAPRDPVVAPQ